MQFVPIWRRRWALALVGCAFWAAGTAPAQGLALTPPVKVEPAPAPDGDDLGALKRQFEQQKQELERQTKLLEELKRRAAPAAGTVPAAAVPAGELPPPPPPDRGVVENIVGDYLRQRDEAARARADAEGYK